MGVEVGTGVGVRVTVGVGTGVEVGTGVGVRVTVGVGTGVEVGTGVGVRVTVGVGMGVEVGTGVGVRVTVGVGTGVVGVGVGVLIPNAFAALIFPRLRLFLREKGDYHRIQGFYFLSVHQSEKETGILKGLQLRNVRCCHRCPIQVGISTGFRCAVNADARSGQIN